MTNRIYDTPLSVDSANPAITLTDAGNTIIDNDIKNTVGIALQATGRQSILIGAARSVIGNLDALDLKGASNSVYNEGVIKSESGAGIRFSGGGTNLVTNKGTITANSDKAIIGGSGADTVINTGTIEFAPSATGTTLIDLGDGADFYDGIKGTVTRGLIKLGGGDDTAYGGTGDESFSGGTGINYIDGGEGNDTINYSDAEAGVDVNLGGERGANSDTLLNIENVLGSKLDDKIVGSSVNNTLEGGEGNDTLEGGGGDDRLDGGEGNNTVRYSSSIGARVDLSRSGPQDRTGYGADTLVRINNIEGGSGDDDFTGNAAGNRLTGNGGNDTLTGGGGNDMLEGGSGQDMAVFSGASTDYTRTDGPNGTVTFTDKQVERDGTDTLKDIRLVKFSDKIIALTNSNPSDVSLTSPFVFEDKAVNSVLGMLDGSDPDGDALTYSLVSSPGGFFGLNGSGTGLVLLKALDYETATQHSITIKAEDKYGGVLTETFTITVRNVLETTPLVRYGTSKGEQLVGESGNDQLFGLSGNDQLFGQDGNDRLVGGAGNDTLDGGMGKDIFVFDQKPNVRSNLDYIQNFNPTDDTIHLSRKFFTKLSKGTLSSKAFVTGNQFKDKDDRILYYKEGGALFYDPDGSGSAKAIQFANLAKGLKISHNDFFVF
jgi:Ca2+-binding RTX toxin-like protein